LKLKFEVMVGVLGVFFCGKDREEAKEVAEFG
jgi:hypothetical protein